MFSMSKKFRNRLLALFCLLVFLGLGGVFYVKWVVQRPFAVILFLADNLTPSVLTPARNYEGGADHRLALESFPYLALAMGRRRRPRSARAARGTTAHWA
jgi:hypothetical protein